MLRTRKTELLEVLSQLYRSWLIFSVLFNPVPSLFFFRFVFFFLLVALLIFLQRRNCLTTLGLFAAQTAWTVPKPPSCTLSSSLSPTTYKWWFLRLFQVHYILRYISYHIYIYFIYLVRYISWSVWESLFGVYAGSGCWSKPQEVEKINSKGQEIVPKCCTFFILCLPLI